MKTGFRNHQKKIPNPCFLAAFLFFITFFLISSCLSC